MVRYDYMVCSAQLMRVTFVNGRWQGATPPDTPDALSTCPDLWEFLQRVGNNGWELVSVTTEQSEEQLKGFSTLYFKRERT